MRKLQLFTHYTVLATTPALFAYPQNNLPQDQYHVKHYGHRQGTEEWACPTTYDEIIQMLEDLDSGELERRYSPMQLEQVNEYLTALAKEGILPNEPAEEAVLEEDIYDLMHGEESPFQLIRYLEDGSEYVILPAVMDSCLDYDIIQCGKIRRAWKKTKKFARKHKKAIIIGAVVVVAAAAITVAVVAAASANTATAAAGALGAAASGSGSSSSDSGYPESKEPSSVSAITKELSPITNVNESSMMKAAIEEHVSSFKEFLVEDNAVRQPIPSKGWDDLSFGEKAREVGANAAHIAFDEIADLVKVVPQLCEEVKGISSKILPESLAAPNHENVESPIENYANLVAKGHEVIDKVFSTDQAEFFTKEAKANDPMNNFAIGMLPSPLPGSFTKIFSNANRFKEAGRVLDRRGFTKAGRGLMKHGYREGSVFPKPRGDPPQINRQGQMILEEILNDPKNKVYQFSDGSLKVYAPNGRGVSFKKDGTFKGFVEWQYE
ncbi:MAG: hypothetical protein Tsb0015_15010 [Simkaniaceae bacterium]